MKPAKKTTKRRPASPQPPPPIPSAPPDPPKPVPEHVDRPRPCTEFQYAVKLVQGKSPALTNTSFIAPGSYYTAINVHNPSTCKTVTFRWKVALTDVDGRHDSRIFAFREARLRPDEAVEIDARDVAQATNIALPRFIKGFVVIESPCELDVVPVYTAIPLGQGPTATPSPNLAFHTERVPARKIDACLDLTLDISTGVADWMLTSSPMPSVNTPCQATVIQNADILLTPPWATQAGSKWVSARGAVKFPPAFASGWYLFQHCFTLCSGFTNPVLSMSALVDDRAWIRLNGAWVSPFTFGSPHIPWNLVGPPFTVAPITQGFLPGRNCLEIVVFNDPNSHISNPVGLNVRGTLKAERGACPEGCGCGCS